MGSLVGMLLGGFSRFTEVSEDGGGLGELMVDERGERLVTRERPRM